MGVAAELEVDVGLFCQFEVVGLVVEEEGELGFIHVDN